MHRPESIPDHSTIPEKLDHGGKDDHQAKGNTDSQEVFVFNGGIDVGEAQDDDTSQKDRETASQFGFGIGADKEGTHGSDDEPGKNQLSRYQEYDRDDKTRQQGDAGAREFELETGDQGGKLGEGIAPVKCNGYVSFLVRLTRISSLFYGSLRR